MISDNSVRMDQILHGILEAIQDSTAVFFMDREGMPIGQASRLEGLSDDQVQQLTSFSGAMHESAQEQGHILGLGAVQFHLIEYENGYFVARGMGPGLILVFGEKMIDIGLAAQIFHQYEQELSGIVEDTYCIDTGGEMPDDIRSMFKTEFDEFK